MNDWDILQEMLDNWILTHTRTFEQRQSLIPIRDFIFDRTNDGVNILKEITK